MCFQVKPSLVSVSPNSVMEPKRAPALSAQPFQDAKSSVVFVHAFGSRAQRCFDPEREALSCCVKYSSVALVTASGWGETELLPVEASFDHPLQDAGPLKSSSLSPKWGSRSSLGMTTSKGIMLTRRRIASPTLRRPGL